MICLFIDTSMANVSISIIRDNEIVSLIQREVLNMHSAYVTKFVKDAIDNASIDANSIDNIMVVNGPGSFTGVRIGVTIAKTYGYLINKDIIPISSLKSLAISSNHNGVVMSVIAANKNSYYVGLYDKDLNELSCEKCMNRDEVISLCNQYNPYIVSNDSNVLGKYKFHKQVLDISKVVMYYKDMPKVNYHVLLPNYLKLPQALEGK